MPVTISAQNKKRKIDEISNAKENKKNQMNVQVKMANSARDKSHGRKATSSAEEKKSGKVNNKRDNTEPPAKKVLND